MLLSEPKFQDPETTLSGKTRAFVDFNSLETLWFNTGTQCNLSCANCYIESSPSNDALSFISRDDVAPYLDEIKTLHMPTQLIGLTGGEPFLNPHIIEILDEILERGLQCLVLTNAHRLIHRHKTNLLRLKDCYGSKLSVRVSLDHYSEAQHEAERGSGTFLSALKGIKWLSDQGFNLSIAGRSLSNESLDKARDGYQRVLDHHRVAVDTQNPSQFVLFPEMKTEKDVPEITTECWDILKKSPDDIMCANERMVVKRRGQTSPSVLACTLIAYDTRFDLGSTLVESQKSVSLNHRFCAEFCVLGGASCSSTA